MRRLLHAIRNSDGTGRAAVIVLLVGWMIWLMVTHV